MTTRETGEHAPRVERWHLLTVSDVMHENIVSVSLGATAREIEKVLTEQDVSGVAVKDTGDRVVGIVSWRDVMEWFANTSDREPHRPHDFFRFIDGDTFEYNEYEIPVDDAATARDFMNTELLTIPGTASIKEAAGMMTDNKVHRLLVTDENGEISGIISTMDILRTLTA